MSVNIGRFARVFVNEFRATAKPTPSPYGKRVWTNPVLTETERQKFGFVQGLDAFKLETVKENPEGFHVGVDPFSEGLYCAPPDQAAYYGSHLLELLPNQEERMEVNQYGQLYFPEGTKIIPKALYEVCPKFKDRMSDRGPSLLERLEHSFNRAVREARVLGNE